MTAISIWCDEAARATYLLTDGAVFEEKTGKISMLQSKVLMLGEARLAVGIAGRAGPLDLLNAWNETAIFPAQSSLLSSLPAALRMCFNRRAKPHPRDQVRLYVGMWDQSRRAPRAFIMDTSADSICPEVEPYRLHELEGFTCPPADASVLPLGYVDDPRRDGRRIIRAQRSFRFPHLQGHCGVAGSAMLYKVFAAGIESEELVRFPEGVGETANPDALGVDIQEPPSLAA